MISKYGLIFMSSVLILANSTYGRENEINMNSFMGGLRDYQLKNGHPPKDFYDLNTALTCVFDNKEFTIRPSRASLSWSPKKCRYGYRFIHLTGNVIRIDAIDRSGKVIDFVTNNMTIEEYYQNNIKRRSHETKSK